MTEALQPNQRLGSRGMTGVSLMFALLFMTATSAAPGDWRDEQWVDMDTGQLIGTDQLNNNPRDTMPIVVNATCSESPSRRALSCYFVRLSVEIDAKTKQCNADIVTYREMLTPVERSAARVVWLMSTNFDP